MTLLTEVYLAYNECYDRRRRQCRSIYNAELTKLLMCQVSKRVQVALIDDGGQNSESCFSAGSFPVSKMKT